MRWRREEVDKEKLRPRLLLLGFGVVLLVGILVFRQYETNKQRENMAEQERASEQTEAETEKPPAAGQTADMEKNTETGKALEQEGSEQGKGVVITNLNEYADAVMEENSILLQERLSLYVKEQWLTAGTGEIIHVSVPQSDPESFNFYVRLLNEQKTIVLLSYHPRENLVTASECSYSEEEIKNNIWEDNGPADRDVPEEMDTEFLQEQEEMNHDITGEN